MREKRPENHSLASRTQVVHTAADSRSRRWLPWKLVVVVLSLATLFALEALFLRFGPTISVSGDAVVVFVVLGLLVCVALVSELVWWLLFARSLAHLLIGRDTEDRKELP